MTHHPSCQSMRRVARSISWSATYTKITLEKKPGAIKMWIRWTPVELAKPQSDCRKLSGKGKVMECPLTSAGAHNKNQNETAAVTQDPLPKAASENQVVNCETSSSALCANTIRGNESQLFLSESAIQFVSEVDESVVVEVSSRRRSCEISVLGVISVEEPDKPVDNAPVSSESTSPVVYVPDDPAVVS
ncbi:hypothetical protein DAPPUDRAFT_119332 [Daphnia pulex]|uniref:Uncharacterized protein n=1 Tax=Daphnia pulex TaxID=6669 RepID=E9HY78_DAPPU|nr:hypothetical protein DAPPUDRAFT_119332 [Daphnia pulex]|eukprot:EFX63303.1 hypothetical protein DAPPUDRAFT_119332 [Daphnia pulex]